MDSGYESATLHIYEKNIEKNQESSGQVQNPGEYLENTWNVPGIYHKCTRKVMQKYC